MRNLSQSLTPTRLNPLNRLFFLLTVALFFSACTTTPRPPAPDQLPPETGAQKSPTGEQPSEAGVAAGADQGPQPVDTSGLEQMATDGRFLDAALAYIKLAAEYPSPLRETYTLRAAELLMTGNYTPQASQLLQEIINQPLAAELEVRRSILNARIALAQGKPDEALRQLNQQTFLLTAGHPGLLAQLHRLRAEAFVQQQQYLGAAMERIESEALIDDQTAIEENQQQILLTLKNLPTAELLTLRPADASETLMGWLELAAIAQGDKNIEQSNNALFAWRKRYPRHPALNSILNEILAARPPVVPLPQQIALILPLNNKFANAAAAVRDGFLAAYYAQHATASQNPVPGTVIPRIRIYDEGDKPEQISAIVNQAVHDGAQFVVGPLDKDAVNRLAREIRLPAPILALNFSEVNPARPDNDALTQQNTLYQMSLSPEQEASQVAERAWLDGHARAAIITPNTSWGDRVSEAFMKRWREFGGDIVETQTYDANKSDYSLPIRQLLNVDESEDRRTSLNRLLSEKLEFIPRRRQDVDFIFMAASSRQARLIRPQLRFHHAASVPVYTTSNSYSGVTNAEADRDMDGVVFSDIPWALDSERPHSDLKSRIETLWPTNSKLYTRLYALGVDAYFIIGELGRLQRNRADFFAGETGDLYLDPANRLQRRLEWARFDGGIPRVISGL